MLVEIMRFLHITGIALWLGSLLSLIVVVILSKKQSDSREVRGLLRKVTGSFSRWIHPSAIIVVVSGILWIVNGSWGGTESEDYPFWLSYMEIGGMMIALISIVILGFVSNRLVRKPLGAESADVAKVKKGLSTYIVLLTIFFLLILSVVYVVAFRF